jgi:hypothetical protein
MSENIVPFEPRLVPDEEQAVDVLDAAALNLLRLEVIGSAAIIERALNEGLLTKAMVGNPGAIRRRLLQEVIDSVDLAGLEYVLRHGEFMGIIGEVSVDPEAPPTLEVVVRLQNGWPIDMVCLVAALADEEAFLRLLDSDDTGLTATLEALRDRLGAGVPF